jgi:hypothetical protein
MSAPRLDCLHPTLALIGMPAGDRRRCAPEIGLRSQLSRWRGE